MSRAFWRPPTKLRQSTAGCFTKAALSTDPAPLTSVTGTPARRTSAKARLKEMKPPSVGVLAITELPHSACTNTACNSTDMG